MKGNGLIIRKPFQKRKIVVITNHEKIFFTVCNINLSENIGLLLCMMNIELRI